MKLASALAWRSSRARSLRSRSDSAEREASTKRICGVTPSAGASASATRFTVIALLRSSSSAAVSDRLSTPSETGCALLLVDLDGFKRVNDILGHQTGDVCLVETANRLSAAAENADLVSRVGGDEFAVIYNGASIHQIEAAAARIVAALQWDAGDGIMLGASVGIAWASPGSTSASLYEEADKAMYRAKTSGRNRFVAHRPAGDLDAA